MISPLVRPMIRNFAVGLAVVMVAITLLNRCGHAQESLDTIVDEVQPRMVKVYGAGGTRGLEAYQSGMLVSADGLVMTVWSYVLDVDPIVVILNDGRRFNAKLKGYDPRLEIALLDIAATELDHFNLDEAVQLQAGNRVLAFSNLFGVATGNEPFSVLHGNVSAVTRLDARRGAFRSTYTGEVYIVDAMTNNPGSAGGALTNRRGEIAGILGKELRSAQYNIWLNYAIPIKELRASVADILAGKWSPRIANDDVRRPVDPLKLSMLGIILVPDIIENTPPFIDRIVDGSVADRIGMQPDDLILFVNDRVMRSCKDIREELSFVERDQQVSISYRRADSIKTVMLKID